MPMVDERIVQMQFNNREFEQNAQQSISTLEKLKQALHLDNAAEGFSRIQEAASNLTFSVMGDSIGIITDKFSILQAVGVRVLNDIVGKVHEATQQFGGLIKSMSVDQISAGWEKFGNKTKAVATIVSQGYDLNEVNDQLERLNWFTDETSYNFTDMVGNIGKFTATGQKLDDSVTAMEGIALWAALSGQNAGTASRAMYQLSQAMGAGVLRKEDYKSIQNASMDTDEFRQKALDAAVALGKLKKNSDGTYSSLVSAAKAGQNFTKGKLAESLTEGQWFDTDVMMEVFKNYSGAVEQLYAAVKSGEYDTASEAIEGMAGSLDEFQLKAFKAGQEARTWADVVDSVKDAVSTGWMNTFEIIFGNYEEAKQLWTDLANALWDVFAGGAEARNEMLSEWKELGGRDALLKSFWNTFNSLVTVIEQVKGAFHDIFPPMEAENLYNMTVNLQAFTDKFAGFFKNFERYGELKEEGIFSYKDEKDHLDQMDDTIAKLVAQRDKLVDEEGLIPDDPEKTKELAEQVGKLNDRIEALTANRDEFKKGMIDEKQYRIIDGVYSALQGIFALLDIGRMALGAVFDIATRFVNALFPMTNGIFEAGKSFGEWAVGLRDSLKESEFFDRIVTSLAPKIVAFAQVVQNVASTIKGWLGTALEYIRPILEWLMNLLKPLLDEVKTFFGLNEDINRFADAGVSMADAMGTATEKLGPLGTVLKTVGDVFEWFFGLFKKSDETTEKVSIFSKAIDFFKKVIERVKEVLSGAKPIFDAIGEALGQVWDKMHSNILNFLTNVNASDAMALANGGILGLLGVGLLNIVNGLQSAFSEFKGLGDMIKGSSSTIAEALGNVFQALNPVKEDESLGDTLLKAAGAIAILAGSLILLATVPSKDLFAAAAAIGAIAGVLYLLMKGLTQLSSSSSDESGSGGILGKIFGSKGSSTKESSIIKISAALLMVSVGIGLLASAVKKLAGLSIVEVVQGVAAIGVMMLMLVKVAEQLGKMEGKALKGAGTLIVFANAIKILAGVVKKLGELDPDALVRGLLGLGVVLVELLAFMNLLEKDSGFGVGTGVGVIALATGLLILFNTIKKMGEMDNNKLALGLFGVAVAMGEIVLFTKLMDGKKLFATSIAVMALSTGLVILAKAVSIFGNMDLKSLAKGLGAVGVALVAMGVFAALTYGNNFAMLGVGMIAMSTGILILSAALKVMSSIPIPDLLVSLGALVAVFVLMGVAAATLGESVLVILGLSAAIALLGVGLIAISAGLAALGGSMVIFASSIVTNIALIIDAFVVLVGGILDAIGILIPKLVEVGTALILALLQGIANNIEAITVSAVGIITNFILGIAESLSMIIEAGIALVLALINGIAQGLQEHGPELAAAFYNLLESILSLLWEMIKGFFGFIGDAFSWIIDKLSWVGEKLGIISKASAEEYDNSFNIEEPTRQELDNTVNTINSKTGEVTNATNTLGSNSVSALESWLSKYGQVGDEATNNYIMSFINANTGGVQGLPEEALEILKQYGWDFETKGQDAGQGYANGIMSKIDAAQFAADQLGKHTIASLQRAQLSYSPSRITTKLGGYFGDGYVVGIESREKDAEKAAGNLGHSAIDSMRGALSRVSDVLGSDLDNAPTIRPVMDLSDVDAGMSTIDGMFGDRTLRLAGANASIFGANSLSGANPANNPIVSEITKLRGDISTLSDSVGKMKIVMDSGALVGQITKPMDNSLGRRAALKGRGL